MISINQFGNIVTIRDGNKLIRQYPCNSAEDARIIYKRLKEQYLTPKKRNKL